MATSKSKEKKPLPAKKQPPSDKQYRQMTGLMGGGKSKK